MIKRYINWRIKRLEAKPYGTPKSQHKLQKLKTTRDWHRFGSLKFGEDITHEPRSMDDVRGAMAEQWKQESEHLTQSSPADLHVKIEFEDADCTYGYITPYLNGKPLKKMKFQPPFNYDGSENKDSLENVRKRIYGIRQQANSVTG